MLDKTDLSADEVLSVTVKVTNTGRIKGKEIVQLFLSDLVASITPPVKSLKRFTKVELGPGRSETVRFELGWDDFAFIGRDNKPVVEPGEFKVTVADLSTGFVIH